MEPIIGLKLFGAVVAVTSIVAGKRSGIGFLPNSYLCGSIRACGAGIKITHANGIIAGSSAFLAPIAPVI